MKNKIVGASIGGKLKKSVLFDIFYEKGILYFILSFMLPFIIMLYAFHENYMTMLWISDGELQKTGSNQFLVVDLWHQYYPFFRVLREKLLTGGSLLYSWQNGIGTNFIALIAYYAASPLNLLSVFFGEDYTREALMYILAAKVGFCGAFFSCFLRYTFGRKDFSIVAFSSIFALCSYTLGYYWNVMWFDTISLFPLVMLGIVALCREKKWKLYTIALALSLITNYYIGFFTCVFTIFMFAFTAIIEWQGFKAFFNRIWLIVRSSVIGICLGGFILLPAYRALQLTYGIDSTFPKELKCENKWIDIFANLISYNAPTSKDGLPNFACGMLALVLFGVFLFAKGIKIREKVSGVLLLALIAVSCNLNQLNFMWHGFHATNQIPYRYSFIFSFILVVMAFRAYDIILQKGVKYYQIILMLVGPAVVFYLYYLSANASEEKFSFENTEFKSSLLITGAYILILICMKFIPIKDKSLRTAIMNLIMAFVICSELSNNAVIGVGTVGSSDYASYPSMNKEVQTLLDEAESYDNPLFYRTEMTRTYTLNDSALYGYNGLSQFSSSANVSITRLYQKLGLYGSEAGNRYYYRTATPVVNSIFGVDYIISKLSELKSEAAFLEQIAEEDKVYLYRNKYPLSLGFMMNEEILNTEEFNTENPFEYQNDIMSKATGLDVDLFTAQPVKLVNYDKVTVEKEQYGKYSYTVENAASANAVYDFAGVDGSYLYGYLKGTKVENIEVSCGTSIIDSGIESKGYSIAFPMSDVQGGETVSVKLKFEESATSGNYTFVTYALNEELFRQLYDKLADEQFEITSFSDTEIKGNINAKEDGVLYFSIPYEKGWSVYIDGEKADTFPVLDAVLGVNAEAGSHEITLKYIPDGFVTGTIAGGAALLLFVIFALSDLKKSKKTEQLPQIQHIDNGKMDDISAYGAVNDLGFAANIAPEAEKAENLTDNEDIGGNDEKPESSDSLQGD